MWQPSVNTEKEKGRMAGSINIFLVLSSDFSCFVLCPQNYAEYLLLLHITNMKPKNQRGREWHSHDSNTGLPDSCFAHCFHSTRAVK